MSIDSVNRQYTNLVRSIGQAALSSLSPHDFEYYMVALELTDGSGRTIDYFSVAGVQAPDLSKLNSEISFTD